MSKEVQRHCSKKPDYDTKGKTYVESGSFKPVFDYPENQALSALCYGLGNSHIATNSALITSDTPTHPNHPNLDALAKVTKKRNALRSNTNRYQAAKAKTPRSNGTAL